jgi:ribonuclease T1
MTWGNPSLAKLSRSSFRAAVLIWLVLGQYALGYPQPARADAAQALALANNPNAAIAAAELPPEAQKTLALIKQGGPFPYRRDGAAFGNRERLLPQRPSGYYHEYTVPTPGARNRGARRIIAGRHGEFYFSDDHYRTFRLIKQ